MDGANTSSSCVALYATSFSDSSCWLARNILASTCVKIALGCTKKSCRTQHRSSGFGKIRHAAQMRRKGIVLAFYHRLEQIAHSRKSNPNNDEEANKSKISFTLPIPYLPFPLLQHTPPTPAPPSHPTTLKQAQTSPAYQASPRTDPPSSAPAPSPPPPSAPHSPAATRAARAPGTPS